MNRWRAIALWAVATIVLAGSTSLFVSEWRHHADPEGAVESEEDFHHWMHSRLHFTASQQQALEPFELAFEEKRAELREEISQAGRELAEAVRGGKSQSPEIDLALSKLNAAQAELQRATLEHFFAMKEHLDPDQAELLLKWTHDSIVHE